MRSYGCAPESSESRKEKKAWSSDLRSPMDRRDDGPNPLSRGLVLLGGPAQGIVTTLEVSDRGPFAT